MSAALQPASGFDHRALRLLAEVQLGDDPQQAVIPLEAFGQAEVQPFSDRFRPEQMELWKRVRVIMLSEHGAEHPAESAWRREDEHWFRRVPTIGSASGCQK